MSGSDIQARVNQGLLNAIAATGSSGHIKINRNSGIIDPEAGTVSGGTTTYDLTAISLPATSGVSSGDDTEGTEVTVVMTNDVEPLMSDEITIGGINHKPVKIIEVNPAGDTLLYKVVCRA